MCESSGECRCFHGWSGLNCSSQAGQLTTTPTETVCFLNIQPQPGSLRLLTREKESVRREGKGRRCCLGDGIDSIPCRSSLQYLGLDDLKKRITRITGTWCKGCFEKMDDHPVHTIPNLKTFIQIILAAKLLV